MCLTAFTAHMIFMVVFHESYTCVILPSIPVVYLIGDISNILFSHNFMQNTGFVER